ncbi:hypothetical protein [Thorsellia kenyensis]|uniref:Uncharacterized protein n=1 Tax=Thorsellia kenyensis TaxID=1549888 RepID=A0ABV6CAM6_9GAMM
MGLKNSDYEVSIIFKETYNDEEGKQQVDIVDLFLSSSSKTIKTARDINIGDVILPKNNKS